MTTATLDRIDLPVHQPTPYEIWRSTQPYVGRHRGAPAVETETPNTTPAPVSSSPN